jgi:alpha-galactosidase/6-phospho-beta-glucosidase family protein
MLGPPAVGLTPARHSDYDVSAWRRGALKGRLMKKARIVFVGGGSVAWTPNIVKDMLLTPALAGSEFVLYDTDLPAARRVAAFLKKLDGRLKTGSSFTPTADRARAFDGADCFVITISTGGLDAMGLDLSIPEGYGIYHTVGDTVGPGGWARALRNFPVFEDLAREINLRAPGAAVLNYTNPMTVLTAALARLCTGPVVGLCHGLFENLEFLTARYGLKDESELSVSYAGVNHFFWTTRVRARGRDVMPDLLSATRRRGLTQLREEAQPDPMGFTSSRRDVANALFLETGVLPYLGDRHTCEFFPAYITDRDLMRSAGLVRTTIAERRKIFRKRVARLAAMTAGEIPPEFFTRSRETAADILAALVTGTPFIDVGNVPNAGQVANLPRGAVVETAVRVDSNGFSPICFGDLPPAVLGYVEPVVLSQEATIRACLERDRELALQALRMDPVCARLTSGQARELGERLLAAHREFVGGMFGARRKTAARAARTPGH